MFIVVYVYGGLIESVSIVSDRIEAISRAKALWERADPQADDLKVFGNDGVVVWMTPEEKAELEWRRR